MKRAISLILFGTLSLLSLACSREKTLEVGQFAPYVERFEAASREEGNPVIVDDLVIRFGNLLTPQERGACELSSNQTPTIVIRQDTWERMDEAEREELIFHEMGHCVLFRTHRDQVLNDTGMPASIMNSYLIRGNLYHMNKAYYVQELFRGEASVTEQKEAK